MSTLQFACKNTTNLYLSQTLTVNKMCVIIVSEGYAADYKRYKYSFFFQKIDYLMFFCNKTAQIFGK
jgi:hypothetical protein